MTIESLKDPGSDTKKFSGNNYVTTYLNHIDFLAGIKQEGPQQYHALMHGLYKDICGRDLSSEFSSVFLY